jgi:hypothetical protein
MITTPFEFQPMSEAVSTDQGQKDRLVGARVPVTSENRHNKETMVTHHGQGTNRRLPSRCCRIGAVFERITQTFHSLTTRPTDQLHP